MARWHMLTVVGRDRPGIVARLTAALFEGGCNLGEASMMRLGGSFTVMLMVEREGAAADLTAVVAPVAEALDLRCHVDAIEGALHEHVEPDVRVSVYGADRAGIVAEVVGALAAAGLNVVDLESAVAGTPAEPLYILQIEGRALQGIEALQKAIDALSTTAKLDVRLRPVETLVG